ncbi:hypothetical protein ES703_62932 [subsurface metagenome]
MFAADINNYLVGTVFDTIFLFELVGYGGSQLNYSRCGRVFGLTGLQRLDSGILDIIRRIEIRRPCTKTNYVRTLGF